MDEETAFAIGRGWLYAARASEDRLGLLVDTLQRIGVEPEAHALAADNRLALLAGKELWTATLDIGTGGRDDLDARTCRPRD